MPAFSYDSPFNNAANWGGTGLMEIPTARVLDEGRLRLGYAQADPYRWYVIAMGVFPGLELDLRLTEMRNVRGEFFRHFKDRTFDLKYQIFPESKRFPAVAVGVHDLYGTRLFPAEYLVFSRQIFPLDFTLGIGRNRLRGPLRLPFFDQFGLFGGVELALHERLHLMAEYNPIEYEKDRGAAGGAVPEGGAWPFNFGVRTKILPGMDLGISYQRGDTLGVMLHLQAELGRPAFPHKADPPPQVSVDRRPFAERNLRRVVEEIHEAIHKAGFFDVSVHTNGLDLTAEFANGRYLSDQKAVGRVLRILLFHSPSDTRRLTAVVRRRNMPILRVSVEPEHLEKYLFRKMPEDVFARLVEVQTTSETLDPNKGPYVSTEDGMKPSLILGVKPNIEPFLLDRSNYVQVSLGLKPYVASNIWKGAYAYARYDLPLYSDITANAEIPADAVRSDFAEYMNTFSFDRLMVDQAFRITERTFGRLSLGYLEKMYAGAGGEILTFLGEGDLALGIEGDWVVKREPDTQFELMDFDRYTLLGTTYYKIPGLSLTLCAKFGRFLYGDKGVLLDLSREFESGALLGVWYSYTDSDKLTDFNEGYHSKGIYLSLPVRTFLTHDSPKRYNYVISPWTRDVGATVYHWQPLYGLGSELMPAGFKREIGGLNE